MYPNESIRDMIHATLSFGLFQVTFVPITDISIFDITTVYTNFSFSEIYDILYQAKRWGTLFPHRPMTSLSLLELD